MPETLRAARAGDTSLPADHDYASLRLLGWVMIAVMLIMAGMMGWRTLAAIEEDRHLTLQSELANGLVAVRALEEHATQTFHDGIQALDRVARKINADPSGQLGDIRRIRTLIADYDLGQSPYLKAVQFVTMDGTSWIASADFPLHQVDVSDRPHIRYLLEHQDHESPVIGHPYASRYDSQLVVPVARMLRARNQEPIGIISVDIRLAYFGQLYSRVAKDNNACVALIADDGFVIVRSPFEARYVDRDLTNSPVLANLKTWPAEGDFYDDSFLDDERPRHYVYRKMEGLPMIALYGRDLDAIYSPWQARREARLFFIYVGSGMVIVLIGLIALFWNRLNRARTQLGVTQEKFYGLFEHSPMPLILIRYPDSRIMEVNQAWSTQLGYTRNEVLGRTTAETNIWVDLEHRNRLIAVLMHDTYLPPNDVLLRHKDGRALTFELSASEFQAGSMRLFVFTLHDVSHERAVEHEIRELNQKLEQRVASRTAKLETANSELTQALKSLEAMQGELIRTEKMAALGSLVAGVAHELNTPIGNSLTVATTIEAHTEAMAHNLASAKITRRQLDDFISALREGSAILTRTLQRAASLVSSFKQVAVDQTGDTRRRFTLSQVIEELATTLEPVLRKTPFRLKLGEIADVKLDSFPGGLIQVLNNFVNNSMLHGFEGRSEGTMTLSGKPVDEGWIEIVFADDGVGIAQECLGRVFDPFYTTKLGAGGSGLGMHIVYNVVTELLGGTIKLDSAPGQGLTITLRIPVKAPEQRPATP